MALPNVLKARVFTGTCRKELSHEKMERLGFENFKMKVAVFEGETVGTMYDVGIDQGMKNIFQSDSW